MARLTEFFTALQFAMFAKEPIPEICKDCHIRVGKRCVLQQDYQLNPQCKERR